MKPFLGPPRTERETWTCGHLASPAATVSCGEEAIWHGFVLDDDAMHIKAMMSSCDEHLLAMKLSADYVHRHQHPCGVPSSEFLWPENECVLDWDEAELSAMASVGQDAPAGAS